MKRQSTTEEGQTNTRNSISWKTLGKYPQINKDNHHTQGKLTFK